MNLNGLHQELELFFLFLFFFYTKMCEMWVVELLKQK